MSRRHIAYAVLVVASIVVSACSQPTAPIANDTANCRGGFIIGTGNTCK
jgi:hypothetical protein